MFCCINRVVRVCGQYAGAIRLCAPPSCVTQTVPSKLFTTVIHQNHGISWNKSPLSSYVCKASSSWLCNVPAIASNFLQQSSRSYFERKIVMEKANIRTGNRTTVEMVPQRFFRLHWGMWIRRVAGSHRTLWAKNSKRRARLRRHMMCTATQCKLLDKMVAPYWREPKYYVDDPYAPYHKREDFYLTRKAPLDIPPRL